MVLELKVRFNFVTYGRALIKLFEVFDSRERSPDLNHSEQEIFNLQNRQVPSWDGAVTAGMKRSHDFSVDEFVSDMKKRRVTPSYDLREYEFLNF